MFEGQFAALWPKALISSCVCFWQCMREATFKVQLVWRRMSRARRWPQGWGGQVSSEALCTASMLGADACAQVHDGEMQFARGMSCRQITTLKLAHWQCHQNTYKIPFLPWYQTLMKAAVSLSPDAVQRRAEDIPYQMPSCTPVFFNSVGVLHQASSISAAVSGATVASSERIVIPVLPLPAISIQLPWQGIWKCVGPNVVEFFWKTSKQQRC